jgi:hypothetical protein
MRLERIQFDGGVKLQAEVGGWDLEGSVYLPPKLTLGSFLEDRWVLVLFVEFKFITNTVVLLLEN